MLEALSCVYSSIPEDASLRLAQSVQAHRRIFVSGAGRSRLMLMAFAMRLTQMGYIAFVAGDVTTPAITADDLLIVASASGITHSVCHCAGVAQECGADLFSISTCHLIRRYEHVTQILNKTIAQPAGWAIVFLRYSS